MKVNIVPIGNSLGIRIPRALLKLCHMTKEVDLEVKRGVLVIKPTIKKPREGWDEAFKRMHEIKEDQLVIPDSIDLDMENWEW